VDAGRRPGVTSEESAGISRVWTDNYEVHGADKTWLELNRPGTAVARCTAGRLMRDLGLHGARRGKKARTAVPGKDGQRAGDPLNRDFTAPAPDRRWAADYAVIILAAS
jgi:putative transposase